MFRTILFDNDGILVDTEKLYFQANRRIMREQGLDLSAEQYLQFFLNENLGMWHLLEPLGYSADTLAGLRQKRNDYYAGLLATENISVDGARQALETLSTRFQIGIVTSSRREHFTLIHQRTGFAEFFDFVVAEGDYTRSKPDPEPYLVAVKRSGFSPAECLAIEDSPRGLRAAKTAGLACWIIPSELTKAGEFTASDKVLSSINDLTGMLLPHPRDIE